MNGKLLHKQQAVYQSSLWSKITAYLEKGTNCTNQLSQMKVPQRVRIWVWREIRHKQQLNFQETFRTNWKFQITERWKYFLSQSLVFDFRRYKSVTLQRLFSNLLEITKLLIQSICRSLMTIFRNFTCSLFTRHTPFQFFRDNFWETYNLKNLTSSFKTFLGIVKALNSSFK